MGRPLKIAKSQAVLTITGTGSGLGAAVTVSQNLTTAPTVGVIPGMPFVVASTVGGLTAGTIYYINAITGNHTFTVSTTQLSVQPRVLATLTTTTGQSVAATVGLVDYGFNNPNNSNTSAPSGSNASFGVVGGNTTQYGKQTLCNVAFGANIAGTIFASNASPTVVGLGTDFANVANGTHLYAYQGNPGSYSLNLLGTVSNNVGNVSIGIANTSATGNVIGTSGNAQLLVSGDPVVFDTTFGGLTAGNTYFVHTIANAAAFTVSATPGGANVGLTSNSSVTAIALQQQIVLSANSIVNAAGYNGYGDPILGALPEAGYIVRQKGKTKYLVTGLTTGITAQAYTANVANTALTPNTMSIIATDSASDTLYVSSLSDYQTRLFPNQVADGSFTPGTQYVIYYSGNTNWTAIGAASNITGITFTATGAGGSGTGTAVLSSSSGETPSDSNPDVIASFNTAYPANQFYTPSNPIVTINNA